MNSPPRERDEFLYTRRTLVAALIFSGAFAVVLYLMHRPAWCKSGLGLWANAWTSCTSQHLFDPYALTHVLHGVIFYWLVRPLAPQLSLKWRFVLALGLEVAWEILENSPWVIERYRQDTAALDYTGDSILNAVGDLLATAVGFVLAAKLSWRWSAGLFVVIELGLLYFVRDNLTLNLIMLLFPLEALKEWQLQSLQ
jgi:hypothetical protein